MYILYVNGNCTPYSNICIPPIEPPIIQWIGVLISKISNPNLINDAWSDGVIIGKFEILFCLYVNGDVLPPNGEPNGVIDTT